MTANPSCRSGGSVRHESRSDLPGSSDADLVVYRAGGRAGDDRDGPAAVQLAIAEAIAAEDVAAIQRAIGVQLADVVAESVAVVESVAGGFVWIGTDDDDAAGGRVYADGADAGAIRHNAADAEAYAGADSDRGPVAESGPDMQSRRTALRAEAVEAAEAAEAMTED
jgi:hypothetical protein